MINGDNSVYTDLKMMLNTIKNKTVCFTGHRIIDGDHSAEMRSKLYSVVMSLINDGCDTFICGGAMGFDTEAAECVINLRERCPHIKLLLFLPCRDQTAIWKSGVLLSKYKSILGKADGVFYVSDFYQSGCMHQRNRSMADASSVCVAYMKKSAGGTGYTVSYAEKHGVRVINLA